MMDMMEQAVCQGETTEPTADNEDFEEHCVG